MGALDLRAESGGLWACDDSMSKMGLLSVTRFVRGLEPEGPLLDPQGGEVIIQ
jgi:hypothetical protein